MTIAFFHATGSVKGVWCLAPKQSLPVLGSCKKFKAFKTHAHGHPEVDSCILLDRLLQ
jgi:hypothetical protein